MRRWFWRRQPAQVLPLAAVIMLALLGAVALVVDVGLLWITQRELQKTADSAAMGGVILLPDASAATQQAAWYAQQNMAGAAHLCSAQPTATITPGDRTLAGGGRFYTLTVTVECDAGFTFGRLVSDQPTDLHTLPNDCACVRASATAVIGSTRTLAARRLLRYRHQQRCGRQWHARVRR